MVCCARNCVVNAFTEAEQFRAASVEGYMHTQSENGATSRLLRRDEVEHLTGLRRSTLYDQMRAGTFPRPVAITATARAWRSVEIDAWIAQRCAARDAQAAA